MMLHSLCLVLLLAPSSVAFVGLSPQGGSLLHPSRPLFHSHALLSGPAIVPSRARRARLGGLMMSEENSQVYESSSPRSSVTESRSTVSNVRARVDVADASEDLDASVLATLRRRRRLIKRLGQLKEELSLQEEEKAEFLGEIKTFCTCDEFNMPHALRRMRIWSGGAACFVDDGRVLHVKKRNRAGMGSGTTTLEMSSSSAMSPPPTGLDDVNVNLPQEGDIFLFPYGVLVCWGLSAEMTEELLEVSQFFSKQILSAPECDDFTYSYGDDFDYVTSTDTLVLKTMTGDDEESAERNILEKLAASHGFAQSSKLSSFAEGVQNSIMSTRGLAAELASEGDIKSASQKDIARNLGQLVLDRHTIYLYADVLDSPDVCWEHPEVDPVYKLCESFLELSPRVELLNKRVEVVRELLSLLADELKDKHSSKLEIIIIYLIMIEIALSLFHDITPIVWEIVGRKVASNAGGHAAKAGALTLSMQGMMSVSVITFIGVCMSGLIFAGVFLAWEKLQPLKRLKEWAVQRRIKVQGSKIISQAMKDAWST